jgi:hypothetical protein
MMCHITHHDEIAGPCSSPSLIARECFVPWCTSHWAWLRADDPTECISASRYLRGLCRAAVPASVPSARDFNLARSKTILESSSRDFGIKNHPQGIAV